MGEVIRKTAAVADIVEDARTAYSRAQKRPGTDISAACEAHLGPILALVGAVEAKLAEAKSVVKALEHELEVADQNADGVLGLQADIVWNKIGRPQHDPTYALLYPEGVAGYADVDVLEQPVRMEMLVELLRGHVHPSLPAADADAAADAIAAVQVSLEAAVEAVRKPRARVKMLEKTLQSLARVSATELARMKRALLSKGLSEVQVHEIIPDRPVTKPKKAAPGTSKV